jgi:hypothetical protein
MALGFSSYRFSLLFGLLHAVGLYNGCGFLFIPCFIAYGRVILRVNALTAGLSFAQHSVF